MIYQIYSKFCNKRELVYGISTPVIVVMFSEILMLGFVGQSKTIKGIIGPFHQPLYKLCWSYWPLVTEIHIQGLSKFTRKLDWKYTVGYNEHKFTSITNIIIGKIRSQMTTHCLNVQVDSISRLLQRFMLVSECLFFPHVAVLFFCYLL